MTDAELREYIGQQVELRLSNGTSLIGRLRAGAEASSAGVPYVVELPHLDIASDASEETYTPIASAEAVESIRAVSVSLGDAEIED